MHAQLHSKSHRMPPEHVRLFLHTRKIENENKIKKKNIKRKCKLIQFKFNDLQFFDSIFMFFCLCFC